MLFSFEGIDGSGKSTQAQLLSSALKKEGHSVIDLREPGGTELGEDIRHLLLSPATKVSARAELLLFLAARAEVVNQVIAPALDRGDIVIADRFTDSTLAYQGHGRQVAPISELRRLNSFATSGIQPTRTYLIDLPVDVAESRRAGAPDRMEKTGADFYGRIRNGYLTIANKENRMRVMDGRKPVSSIAQVILRDANRALHQQNS